MKTVSGEELLDWWLFKYHYTNSKEVAKKYPEEVKSPNWFKMFPVTQEQHDEWKSWAMSHIKKVTKLPKAFIKSTWWSVELDCAPYVKEKEVE